MRHPSLRRLQRGAAAIELGILFLPIATLGLGAAEAGRAMYQYNALCKTVRDAARYLSTAPGRLTEARCLAITGSTALNGSNCNSSTILLPGLALSQVYACDETATTDGRCASAALQSYGTAGTVTAGLVNLSSVTVTGFQFSSMLPFAMPSITFGNVSATLSRKI